MTTPRGEPEEIDSETMKLADKIAFDFNRGADNRPLRNIIALALHNYGHEMVREERERCARIAESYECNQHEDKDLCEHECTNKWKMAATIRADGGTGE